MSWWASQDPTRYSRPSLQGRPIVISSFLANEKETTSWVIGNQLGWLTRTPTHLATLLAKLAANPAILERYQQNIRRLNLRSGAPEICEFLYGLVKNTHRKKKQTVGDALRRFRDAVVAEGEAISRRIDASEGIQRLRRATSSHRG